jgi:hypothetical protein
VFSGSTRPEPEEKSGKQQPNYRLPRHCQAEGPALADLFMILV